MDANINTIKLTIIEITGLYHFGCVHCIILLLVILLINLSLKTKNNIALNWEFGELSTINAEGVESWVEPAGRNL